MAERTYAGLIVDPIGESEARMIAADWHGGQASALYSFCSSGHLDVDGALSEARSSMRLAEVTPEEDEYKLMELIDYLERMAQDAPSVDHERKLAKLAAKDFTYVTIWLGVFERDAEGRQYQTYGGARKIVVLTPHKAEAVAAVRQIIKIEGLQTRPYGLNGTGEHFSIYPRTYIREARALLASDPSRVYLVDSQNVTAVHS